MLSPDTPRVVPRHTFAHDGAGSNNGESGNTYAINYFSEFGLRQTSCRQPHGDSQRHHHTPHSSMTNESPKHWPQNNCVVPAILGGLKGGEGLPVGTSGCTHIGCVLWRHASGLCVILGSVHVGRAGHCLRTQGVGGVLAPSEPHLTRPPTPSAQVVSQAQKLRWT